ncbi:MAG: endopeptidase La [Deltaproteobacteria bacterium]|nr:endopeptidase La [Deltaproteobacteria bacterium]
MEKKLNDKKNSEPKKTYVVPLIALKESVVFPTHTVPLFAGRAKTIRAIEAAEDQDLMIMLVAQKEASIEDPKETDLYTVGTLGEIVQSIRKLDVQLSLAVDSKFRAKIKKFLKTDEYFLVEVEEANPVSELTPETQELMKKLRDLFSEYVNIYKPNLKENVLTQLSVIEDPVKLSYSIAPYVNPKFEEKQALLEIDNCKELIIKLCDLIQKEIELFEVEKRFKSRVKKQEQKGQKDFFFNEGIRVLQKELGEKDEFRNEILELEEKLRAKKMPDEARDKTEKEIRKLKMMSPMSAEATVVRNYVDWMLSLPWLEYSDDFIDIQVARKILDEDHYGLEKVKERILEHLAVQKLNNKIKGPILCFVGPPGVGKTSLGRSIARAVGRNFVRVALGGVRDEAEIRGHRRTYIGALPGKIIQGIKKAGTSNPVFLLDEVDKMTVDFRGDPSAALLEVLDPEQNYTFNDHYLDCDYDLSKVMFICTANQLHTIPAPLLDRMEIIRISGYTEIEKLNIAKRHLIPAEIKEVGLDPDKVEFTDEALLKLIREYTREAGVRNLKRTISSLLRKIAVLFVQKDSGVTFPLQIREDNVIKYIGYPPYKQNELESIDPVGSCTGLAWTEKGGELLVIEASVIPGKGRLQITGKLGEVMQESAKAALTYVRSRFSLFGLPKEFFDKVDIHIHVPEGAIPKDGPSAGITIATALVSALTGIPVSKNVAMTGEITLKGTVLPIGGLKEKCLAASRVGIKKVIIPLKNEIDIEEIPAKIRDTIEIVLVSHCDQVLLEALEVKSLEEFAKVVEYFKNQKELLFDNGKRDTRKDQSPVEQEETFQRMTC